MRDEMWLCVNIPNRDYYKHHPNVSDAYGSLMNNILWLGMMYNNENRSNSHIMFNWFNNSFVEGVIRPYMGVFNLEEVKLSVIAISQQISRMILKDMSFNYVEDLKSHSLVIFYGTRIEGVTNEQ
jgi:hypothetical protein